MCICICTYVYMNIIHLCTFFHSYPQLTSTGDGPCQYNTDDSNNKEFHRWLILKRILRFYFFFKLQSFPLCYFLLMCNHKLLSPEKSSSFIAFLYQNWRMCYPYGVVTLSVCSVPLELVMYTKHVYQLQRSNGYHAL